MSKAQEANAGPALAVLCLLIFLAVLPVTLLVPILKPLVADRYPVGPLAVHAFQSVNMVGAMIAAPLAGWFADRLGRRRPLVVGAFLLDAALLLSLGRAPTYPSLMIIRFAEGAAHIAALTCVMGAALALAQRHGERAGAMMGAVGASIVFAVAIGAGLGGLLARGGAGRALWGAAALGVLGAAASLWALRGDEGARAEGSERGLAALARVAREDRAVLIPCVFTFCERLTVGILVSSFALYLGSVLGRPPAAIGLLMSLVLFPFALLCYPFGKLCRVWPKSVMVAGGALLYGAALAALAWVPPGWLPAWMILLGVVSAVNFAPSLAMVADLAGAGARSTAMGAFNAAGSLGFLLGPLVGGLAVQWAFAAGMSPRGAYALAFLAGGGLTALAALLAIPPLVRLVKAGRTT
ncbi:MAG: hypothetical protein A3J27_00865 [Candidatus Tectomicrobia bacterium RIFCSPLOWO2_12_FULL_69_37]|nr:MAG: hypothetical protein A3J27_00865 [Candidatus Tectomicrobia bacterium RIFCSPLOWO2_12_FULL_69_37]